MRLVHHAGPGSFHETGVSRNTRRKIWFFSRWIFRGKKLDARRKRAQNEQLATKYQIQGFPTIVVLDGEGKMVGELGYTPGGPAAFIAELEKLPKS